MWRKERSVSVAVWCSKGGVRLCVISRGRLIRKAVDGLLASGEDTAGKKSDLEERI